ncbi:hypothetical protein E5A73_12185 [Sphingomonas gei]|uniref:Uncharacterized protein n=1 Tax=Sphingomonas gei TaxID=1395960 RepID=A0A4S1XB66_9SPHN|nr:hypothetical protein [Sphingomonas gei]TGX53579.1 hypothetical protein E5A73_12185 [Sphingomonas gei]
MSNIDPQEDTYSEAKTEARREAALKRMLATPHKPHFAGVAKTSAITTVEIRVPKTAKITIPAGLLIPSFYF